MEPETPTARQQRDLETRIASIYRDLADLDADGRVHRIHRGSDALLLQRDRHARYAGAGLGRLPASFASLDASRPWICYWVLHSLALLRAPLPEGVSADDVIAFLRACKADGGGYGGGPGQMAHLAPTYAAVCALLTLGGEAAYESIDRAAVAAFLRRMVVPPERGGGFTMHDGGETDARSCYTAIAVAHMLNLGAAELAEQSAVVGYLRRCQTYEGGLGGEPGNEAHGGYTYCGAAALSLLGRLPALDLPRLARWVAQRQGAVEGGFNGRTNKLVDGCYSFWQGSVMPVLMKEREALTQQALGLAAPLDGDEGIEVPALPAMAGVCSPYEEACAVSERLNDRAELMLESALEAEEALKKQQQEGKQRQGTGHREDTGKPESGAAEQGAESGGDGGGDGGGGGGRDAAEEARFILERAEEAQRAAEEADLVMEIAQYSAAQLFVCFSGDGSRYQQQEQPQQEQPPPEGPSAAAAATAISDKDDWGTSCPGALFETDALQLWVLKGCQVQLKGGLRDKPGKQPDYYHTCYCLSGLSAVQHAAGGTGVLGAPSNQLERVDPLVNLMEERVAEAAAYFAAQPPV